MLSKLKTPMTVMSRDFGGMRKHISEKMVLKKTTRDLLRYACFYDGGEIGSTDA